MEPPSQILTEQNVTSDRNSDDPLSRNIYMEMGKASGESREGLFVRA